MDYSLFPKQLNALDLSVWKGIEDIGTQNLFLSI